MLAVKIKKTFQSRISTISVLALLFTFLSTPAQASSAISIATTNFGAGVPSNVGVTLTGFDQNLNYQVTVKFVDNENIDVTNGTLTATQGGTTLINDTFTSYSAAKLGFKGTYSQIAAALSTLTWNPANPLGNTRIRIGIATQPGTDEFYDANSSRYYKYVSTPTAWSTARTAAENTYLFGLRGYLAEITTSAENNFIANETSATNIWIGATEDETTAANPGGFIGNSYSGAAGQRWIWQGAIQTSLPTGSGGAAGNTGNTLSGVFSSWASGEPNNDLKPGQDCAVTNWNGKKGEWNDLPCTNSQAYFIEFGGRADETSTASITTLTTTVVAQTLTAPGAPTLNTVTAGDKRLTIAFTAGATGGSAITDYEYSLNGGAYISAGTTTSPFTISGLSGRTSYSVTIKAKNSVGLGTASSSVTSTTTDSVLDASDAAAAIAESARVAAAAEAARKARDQQELINILALIPKLGELTLSLGETTRSLYSKKCVKGKTTKFVKKGAKCPKGFVTKR
jgi:hypothetical protein